MSQELCQLHNRSTLMHRTPLVSDVYRISSTVTWSIAVNQEEREYQELEFRGSKRLSQVISCDITNGLLQKAQTSREVPGWPVELRSR